MASLAPVLFVDLYFGFVSTGFVPVNVVIGSVSRNGFGLNIGGGVSIGIGHGSRFFTEVRYHWAEMQGRNTTLLPITFGISF
jgi:hypothetical protein